MRHSFFSFRLCRGFLFAALLGSLVLSGCDSLSLKEEDGAASSLAQPVALPGQRALISQHCNCDNQRETGNDPQPLTFWLANTAGITGYYLSTSATLPSNPT